jgi:hypothetical protein
VNVSISDLYFVSHHTGAAAAAVIAMDIRSENAATFVHSQIDTVKFPVLSSHCTFSENLGVPARSKRAWRYSFYRRA